MGNQQYYHYFFNFIEKHSLNGFRDISSNDPLIEELDNLMETNNQFFYIADIIQLKILYTSKGSYSMVGVSPKDLSPFHFMEITHPDDIPRLNLGRAQLIRMANDLYTAGAGYSILSTVLKMRHPTGIYSNVLIQCYLWFTKIPYKTVFFLKIHSNIDRYKTNKHHFHYYLGDDLSLLRPPDVDLLKLGVTFSSREFEIIRLIAKGMRSEEIAEKIFLSVHTVNTHRRNILKATGKETIAELIYWLQDRGVL